MDALNDLMLKRAPTARRPLLGLTVLVVEDSRFACEALRLMCLRSGARIRRADSLEHAKRHLAVYRPTVVLIDIGLPDGSGIALIEALATATPRIEVILGISGDPATEKGVIAAGADGFIPKPFEKLANFQNTILSHLPADRQPPSPRELSDETVSPDPIAYQDDLSHVAQVLNNSEDQDVLAYVTQFLGGVARSAQDHDLDVAVRKLAKLHSDGDDPGKEVAALAEMVEARIASSGPL